MRKNQIVGPALLALLVSFIPSTTLRAAEPPTGWGEWWLPTNHSVHGGGIDTLFTWIFWITMVTFVIVELVLVAFLVKYRYKPGANRRAVFTHGNTRLEMCWTLAPAVILAVLALASKKVWDGYRYAPANDDPGRANVLVIGEQFKWNVIYPGPDGKLGIYLKYPHPTDEQWPNVAIDPKYTFQNVKGPAELPYAKAVVAIKDYIQQENPLGKDFTDHDGKDDDWVKQPGRGLTFPRGRPIEVQLSSKDVIHDFFLPNFRVKLDAVPGMRGHIYFTARDDMPTSKEREFATRKSYKLEELSAALSVKANAGLMVSIDESTPGADKDKTSWRYSESKSTKKVKPTIIRDGASVPPDPAALATLIDKLRANGVESIQTAVPGSWDLVCEELCGQGHNTMQGTVRFVTIDEYDALKLDKPYRMNDGTPAEQPVTPAKSVTLNETK